MKSLKWSLILSGVMATLMIGSTWAAPQPGTECRQRVDNKCATCHFATYICPQIEKRKGTFYWNGIIHDMVKEGMVATDQEKKQLVSCLAEPDAKLRALCPVKE